MVRKSKWSGTVDKITSEHDAHLYFNESWGMCRGWRQNALFTFLKNERVKDSKGARKKKILSSELNVQLFRSCWNPSYLKITLRTLSQNATFDIFSFTGPSCHSQNNGFEYEYEFPAAGAQPTPHHLWHMPSYLQNLRGLENPLYHTIICHFLTAFISIKAEKRLIYRYNTRQPIRCTYHILYFFLYSLELFFFYPNITDITNNLGSLMYV